MNTDYSQITRKALELFGVCLKVFWGVLILSTVIGLISSFWSDYNGFLDFMFYFIVNSIKIASFIIPFFVIISYPVLVNYTWKSSNILPFKPIVLFAAIQLLNFFVIIYPLRNQYNAFSNEFSIIFFIVSFAVSLGLIHLFINWAKEYRVSRVENEQLFEDNTLPHYLYVGIIGVFVSLLVDLNFYTNISLVAGILMGGTFAFIFQPDKEWKKIVLYFLSPEFYREIYEELESETDRVRNSILIDSRTKALKSTLQSSMSSTQKSKTNVALTYTKAQDTQTRLKLRQIEKNVNQLSKELVNGKISQSDYDKEFKKLTTELKQIHSNLDSINPKQIL